MNWLDIGECLAVFLLSGGEFSYLQLVSIIIYAGGGFGFSLNGALISDLHSYLTAFVTLSQIFLSWWELSVYLCHVLAMIIHRMPFYVPSSLKSIYYAEQCMCLAYITLFRCHEIVARSAVSCVSWMSVVQYRFTAIIDKRIEFAWKWLGQTVLHAQKQIQWNAVSNCNKSNDLKNKWLIFMKCNNNIYARIWFEMRILAQTCMGVVMTNRCMLFCLQHFTYTINQTFVEFA